MGQRSVVGDDLYAVYQTTCDIYLGRGTSVIPALQPRLDALTRFSPRTATISRAKLARAYANAGQPADACRLAWETLDASDTVGSHSAVSEIRRTLRVLRRWNARSDVQDITYRLSGRYCNALYAPLSRFSRIISSGSSCTSPTVDRVTR